ncbi:SlyX protein [Neptunomonas antarctica]|uniref:Protein SlyX homolog n=2 Tax=Neptunomonas antarctica TaxID=619304 RepID=A0A1N7MVG5_9GAMM|nr:SlyX protein [Neptunomonas antarctica]
MLTTTNFYATGAIMNYDERITELESRVAFQEDALDKLNDVIAQQDKMIIDLKRMLTVFNQQLKTVGQESQGISFDEPPPPHY